METVEVEAKAWRHKEIIDNLSNRRRNRRALVTADPSPQEVPPPTSRVSSVTRLATTRASAPSSPAGNLGSQATGAHVIKTVAKIIEVVAAADLPVEEVGSRVSSSSRASGVSEGLALDPSQPQALLLRNGQCR